MNDKFRSRKWILSSYIQAFSSLALVFGWLQGDHYATITAANILAYSGANAVAMFKKDVD
tara:strand:+ start:47 stop:226 length:180 start_codon:yes stop_codon:yes gene_type:complete